jgi:predicted ATPase/serine/threonine protein kinase/DNA-binding CsgD family transcriptional regulator
VDEVAFGRYRLIELIGEGGMGKVYKAHDDTMGRDVAIKVLSPELAQESGYEPRFRREASAAARLTEPHIIPIFEAGEIDGRLYLVMPIIDGVDVQTLLQRDGPLSPQRAVQVIEQLAAALNAAHAAGLVHRDVKPSNALLAEDDFAYLIDFGIAHDAKAPRLTNTGMMIGTLAYMAPERFTTGTADARSDVYALACVLYECLIGVTPYPGDSMEQQIAGHMTLDPPRPSAHRPELPRGFDAVIAAGMAKEPGERYQTARELAGAARRALTEALTSGQKPRPALTLLGERSERHTKASANELEPGATELPVGTVTLLLADVEGSTRLWQSQPRQMTAAIARLDRAVSDAVEAHAGVRPVEQGEGDSFVIAFNRASDAVACALDLQREQLAPIKLRIGVHIGEVQLRDEGNYIGPTINRTARLRDLAHGGQTVLSGTARDVVIDRLPGDAWLTDLGSQPLRDFPRPERVSQLCHPDVRTEFPPLRTADVVAKRHLPAQLTSFLGRTAEMAEVRQLVIDNRLVTLTGAGGSGKTRLAIQVADQSGELFRDGVRYIDLSPITDPATVPVAALRALGVPDQPGRSATETLIRFIGDRAMLVLLDNCEHLLESCASLVIAVLGSCPEVSLLATSREPIGVPGEATWRVPSLSLPDEAVELFIDRARLASSDFCIDDATAATLAEICRRLDGLPLAIELAAARVRALSLGEILDGLNDRFRLLTGSARTAVRRQQTLRASVDWSHALLTEPERIVFRRLAVFLGGFDFQAAQAVSEGGQLQRHQVLDQLSLLIDKSLVVAENRRGRTRYRLLETVRQYAQEKLSESGEAGEVRNQHRDYYTAVADLQDGQALAGHGQRVAQVETEMDNLRAVFAWSRETNDVATALRLVSALYPVWSTRGRIQEGLAWFDAVLTEENLHDDQIPLAVRARALADKVTLDAVLATADSTDQAELGVALARAAGDPALLVRALAARGRLAIYQPEGSAPYFAEAIELARALKGRRRLSDILAWQAYGAVIAGDPIAARVAGEEGRDLADAIGDRVLSRVCRLWLTLTDMMEGDLNEVCRQFDVLFDDADAANDLVLMSIGLLNHARALACRGDGVAARAKADAALEVATAFGGFFEDVAYAAIATAALAVGDVAGATAACDAAWQHTTKARELTVMILAPTAETALARNDLATARSWIDSTTSMTTGWARSAALTTRARLEARLGDSEKAESDAQEALAQAVALQAYLGTPDILECLAGLAARAESLHEAARLFGAADAMRRRYAQVRFKIYDADYETSLTGLRDAIGADEFDAAFAEGAALSTDEAIAYAQRGRGERKRPSTGWASLTPTELGVVRLVSDGLGNKDIATRLSVSPRTVQTHLTHVYTKLGLASRVQLAQEASRHS